MDARIVKTKETIHRTVIELLRRQHLREITVSALCRKANINRNTFYSHYRTPVDVVEEISNELIDELDYIAKRSKESMEICVAICRYLSEKSDVFSVISSTSCDHVYLDIAISRARKSARSDSAYAKRYDNAISQNYCPEFIIGGCVFVLERWIKTGMKESPEEMGKTIHNFLTKCNF